MGDAGDIWGGYENGNENKDEIINESEDVQKIRKDHLVAQGWFTDNQLIIHAYRRKLSSARYVKKSYSYLPLHFMSKYGRKRELKIDDGQIILKYKISNDTISNDTLLNQVKAKLLPYIMGT